MAAFEYIYSSMKVRFVGNRTSTLKLEKNFLCALEKLVVERIVFYRKNIDRVRFGNFGFIFCDLQVLALLMLQLLAIE